MLENIKSSNLQRCEEINEKVKAIKDNIVKMELELKEYFKEIKEMSVKGYFYLYENCRWSKREKRVFTDYESTEAISWAGFSIGTNRTVGALEKFLSKSAMDC